MNITDFLEITKDDCDDICLSACDECLMDDGEFGKGFDPRRCTIIQDHFLGFNVKSDYLTAEGIELKEALYENGIF